MNKVKILHIVGTSKEHCPKNYDSWFGYWISHTKSLCPQICQLCGKTVSKDNPFVGAHVISTKDWKKYIIPCCNQCNLNPSEDKLGLPKVQEIDEDLLVPHPSTLSVSIGIEQP